MNTDNRSIEWRRNKVWELISKGYSQKEVARLMSISQSTVNRDLHFVLEDIYKKRTEISETYYAECHKAIQGSNSILKKLWSIVDNPNTKNKEVLQAIPQIMNCYILRSQFLGSKPIAEDWRRYIEEARKQYDKTSFKEKELKRLYGDHALSGNDHATQSSRGASGGKN